MPDELDTILRLVAEGKLSPEDAAPIIDVLSRAREGASSAHDRVGRHVERAHRHAARAMDRAFRHADQRLEEGLSSLDASLDAGRGRQLRIRVTERGRQVVNLRIPIGFVETALQFVPGLGGDQTQRIRDAVRAGTSGPILDVEDPDGDGVLISVE